MCFTIQDREPTFAETAQQMHQDHVAEVRERHARMSAEESAERLRQQLWQAGIRPDARTDARQPGYIDALDSPRQQSIGRRQGEG